MRELTITIITCLLLSVTSNGQDAKVFVERISPEKSSINAECFYVDNTMEKSREKRDRVLILFIDSNRSNNLQLANINSLNGEESSLYIKLVEPEANIEISFERDRPMGGSTLYPVLLRCDIARLSKTLDLVNAEFSSIEDVLTILNKAGATPIAYSQFNAKL